MCNSGCNKMRTDCPHFDQLPTLTFEETGYTATRDPGLSVIRTQAPELVFAKHRTLKRKHPKRHKKRENHSRLTKTKSLQYEQASAAEQSEVILDGFGNDIRKQPLPQASGDSSQNDDQVKEFSWLFSDVEDENPVQELHRGTVCSDNSLSQHEEYCQWSEGTSDSNCDGYESERSAIEEEIKRKCLEMEKLLDKINAKRLRRSRRLQRQQDEEGNDAFPAFVNIQPIRRRKRTAQPIRNALLIRSSMSKAWKGALGSCCGKGCWATWKWMNLKRVMSDYE